MEKYGIKELDFLLIDAEGQDQKIIHSIDFSKYSIKRIEFEQLHLDDGKKLCDFLEGMGYRHTKNIPSKNPSYNLAYTKASKEEDENFVR